MWARKGSGPLAARLLETRSRGAAAAHWGSRGAPLSAGAARGYGEPVSERQREKGERFAALHAGEPFVIPNSWDAGSARVFAGLGFAALATTSSGFAFTLGRLDGGVSLDELAGHDRSVDHGLRDEARAHPGGDERLRIDAA